jgi:hypothetical protein
MRLPAISSFALLAGIAVAAISMPVAAQAAACPLWVAKFCVVTKNGVRQTVATNPCLAKRAGERILHRGACEGPICSLLYKPVCSLDPFTHAQKTFSSLCWSDINNATFLHNGVCGAK